jgi:hypothetical protein
VAAPVTALVAVLATLIALVARRRRKPPVARVLDRPTDETRTDQESGAVRSVQRAELVMPSEELERIWNPMHLERLARTYWRFLTRMTLGVIRVAYTETTRAVVLFAPPFRLLRFQAPEYEMDGTRGIVRWRIEDGVLVAREGRSHGYLQIDIRRCGPEPDEPGAERISVEVEVANFYPAIAFGLSRWLYANTQSKIHVFVTYGFLRSLQKLDLAPSRVGRFATMDEVPDPPGLDDGASPNGQMSASRAARR